MIVFYFAAFITFTLYCYLIQKPLITPRYTTTIVFMLLLLLGQIVERIVLELEGVKYRKKVIAICAVILCFQIADPLISLSGNYKSYIKVAGLWVKENVDWSREVYSNKLNAAYYSDRRQSARRVKPIKEIVDYLENNKFKPSTYLIVVIRDDKARASESDLWRLHDAGKINFIREFQNEKKDERALIFEVMESVS